MPEVAPLTRASYGADAVLALLEPEPSPPRGERLQGLFLPSFHAETVVTVDLGADDGTATLASFERSLWYALSERELRGPPTLGERLALKRGHELRTPLPGVWREHAALSRQATASLRAWLRSDLVAALSPAARTIGCDGIRLVGLVRDAGGAFHRLEAWSPSPGEPPHGLFATLHRVARETFAPGRARSRLDQLHGYLRLGLPAEDLGGSPRRVRIFGGLSSSDEGALRAFFGELPPGAPLVVDLSELERTATLLFPVFQELARARSVAWVASGLAREQLEGMHLPAASIFDEIDPAVRSLTW